MEVALPTTTTQIGELLAQHKKKSSIMWRWWSWRERDDSLGRLGRNINTQQSTEQKKKAICTTFGKKEKSADPPVTVLIKFVKLELRTGHTNVLRNSNAFNFLVPSTLLRAQMSKFRMTKFFVLFLYVRERERDEKSFWGGQSFLLACCCLLPSTGSWQITLFIRACCCTLF